MGLAVNSKGQIAVVDSKKNCILISDMEGNCLRKVSCHGNTDGQLNGPVDVTYLNDDNILVADELNHRIQQFNVQTGDFVKIFGKRGTRGGEIQNPCSVYVKFYDNTGKFLNKIGEPHLLRPWGICLHKCVDHHNLLVCDTNNGRVNQYTLEGCFTGKTDYKFQYLTGIATTLDGLILASDWGANKIYILK